MQRPRLSTSSRMWSRPRSGEVASVAALSRWLPDGRVAGDFARWFAGWARSGARWLQVDGRALPQREAFFVVGIAQALVHAAHQCLKPCMCSVCRTPGAGAVPLGTVPLSAGRACPPRGASSARRETKSTRVPSHHCDLASALVFWFRWRITRAARVSRIAAQGTPSICMRRPSRPQGLGRIRLWLSNAR